MRERRLRTRYLLTLLATVALVGACSSTATTAPISQAPAATEAASAPAASESTAAATESTAPVTDQEVVVVDGGGTIHDALQVSTYDPFTKATGIKVVSQSYDYSLGAIQAQVQGAKQWDIVATSTPMLDNDAAALFQPIDYSIVTAPDMPTQDKAKYFLWSQYSSNVIAWRTDIFKDGPKTWADVWDVKKFPGPRMLWNSAMSTLEIALMADGVTWDKMYPLDLDRAFKSLDKLASQAKIVWYDSGAQQIQSLATGLAVIGEGWNGRVYKAKSAGLAVDYTPDQSNSGPTAWAVLKTAPHTAAAMKFLDFASQAKPQADMAIAFPGISPSSANAYTMIPPFISDQLPTNPKNASVVAGNLNYDWWAQNLTAVNDRWQTWYTTHK